MADTADTPQKEFTAEDKKLIAELVQFKMSEEAETRRAAGDAALDQRSFDNTNSNRRSQVLTVQYSTADGLAQAKKFHEEQSHKLDEYNKRSPEEKANIERLVRHQMADYSQEISSLNRKSPNNQLDTIVGYDAARLADDLRAGYAKPENYQQAVDFLKDPRSHQIGSNDAHEGRMQASPPTMNYKDLPAKETQVLTSFFEHTWEIRHDAAVKRELHEHPGLSQLDARIAAANHNGKMFDAYKAQHAEQSPEQAIAATEAQSKKEFVEKNQKSLASSYQERQNILNTYDMPKPQEPALAQKPPAAQPAPKQEQPQQQFSAKDNSQLNGLLYKAEVNAWRDTGDNAGKEHMTVQGMVDAKKNGYQVWDKMTGADTQKLAALLQKDKENGGKELARLSGGERASLEQLGVLSPQSAPGQGTAVASAKTGGRTGAG